MIAKIKAYAVLAMSVIVTLLTFGGYAKYQKRRADRLQRENEQASKRERQQQEIARRLREHRIKNNMKRKKAHEQKNSRTFFDNN